MKKKYTKVEAWQGIGFGEVSEQEQCRHFLGLGETGSGKTESLIFPALDAFVLVRVIKINDGIKF